MSHAPMSARDDARRIEVNDVRSAVALAEGLAASSPELGVAQERVAGGVMTFAGDGAPLTRARGLGMAGPVTDGDLGRVDAFFEARGAAATVEVCPYADPSLREGLGRRGYRETQLAHTSTCVLDGAGASRPEASVRVARAGARDADAWSRLVASGFGGDGPIPDGVLEAGVGLFAVPTAACFWAFLDGARAPVGGGAVIVDPVDGALAYLFATSTRAEARGRGVQQALLAARVAFAAAAGCSLAWVSTVPGSASHRNVERAGFRVVYTRVEMRREREGRALASSSQADAGETR